MDSHDHSKMWPDFVTKLEALNLGELDDEAATLVYQELVDTGLIDSMEPHIKKRAEELIESGKIRRDPPV